MADNAQIEIYVRSNTDKLSDRALHDCLVNLVRNEAVMGEVALKAIVPKGESLSLTREAGHKGPYDEGYEVTASVGIPEIHKSDESSPTSAEYPIYVDKGTGIFGGEGYISAKKNIFMYIPESRGIPGWLYKSKGQEGQGFMVATFSTMVSMLRINGEAFKKEFAARIKADKLT